MKRKKFLGLATTCTVVMLLLALVVGSVPVHASDPSTPPASGIAIVNYVLRDGNGQTISAQITKGTTLYVELTMKDTRAAAVGKTPVGVLNTKSFYRASGPELVTGGDNTVGYGDVDAQGNYIIKFPVVYTGEGNTFAFDAYYIDKNDQGRPVKDLEMASFSIALNQCVEYVAPESSSSSSSTETRGTGFVLKSASYGASQVEAGKTFTLDASLLATNGTYAVENTSVTLVLPKEITFATGSSVHYIGTVGPNKTVTASFELFASGAAVNGSYVITIKISGVNAKDGTSVEASADITVPVVQPERFEISNPRMAEYLMVGTSDGSGYSSMELVNKGKGSVYNVEAEIVGEGLSTEEGKQFIGTIAGGSSSSIDFMVMAMMPGQLEGQVVITYENEQGEVKTLTHDFQVMAEEMMMPDPGDSGMVFPEEPTEPQGGIPVWVWLVVGLVVVVGGIVVIVLIRKKRKARKAAEDAADLEEDDDDDFDSTPPAYAPVQQPGPETPPQNPEGN